MRSILISLVLLLMASSTFSQNDLSLTLVPKLSTRLVNLILTSQTSNTFDTLAECSQSYKLIDYIIKSKDSVSVIFKQHFMYSYMQLIKNPISRGWETDSMAMWNTEGASSQMVNNTVVPILYELLDYYTVQKILFDRREVMPLNSLKSMRLRSKD